MSSLFTRQRSLLNRDLNRLFLNQKSCFVINIFFYTNPSLLTLEVDELDVEEECVEGAFRELLLVRRQEVLLLRPARRQQLHAAPHERQPLARHVLIGLNGLVGDGRVVAVARGQLQKSGKRKEKSLFFIGGRNVS